MKLYPVQAELFRTDGQTDEQPGRHDEDHNQFLQLCKYT